jgi:hypothetical protein
VRVLIAFVSPEGAPSQVAMLMPTGGPRFDSPELRSQVQDLVADFRAEAGLSAAEPVIEKRDVPGFGGHWKDPIDVEYGVRLVVEGTVVNLVWAALLKLKSHFDAPDPADAGQAQLRELFALQGDETARYQIEQGFGVPGDELKPVSTGFHGSNGQFVYECKDGSTFVVNVDAATGVALHVVRTWPTGPAVDGDESSS